MKIFIIGLGRQALVHIKIINSMPGLSIVGGYDLDNKARENIHSQFPTFVNLQQGLKATQPDCILIATPPRCRFEFFKYFLTIDSIRLLIVEKPLALSLSEAESMYEFCERNEMELVIVHQSRFAEEFALLKKSIDENQLGNLQFIKMANYGNVFNQGSHAIDLLIWLTKSKVLWVDATRNNNLQHLKFPIEKDKDHPGDLWNNVYLRLENNIEVFMTCGVLDVCPIPQHGPWMQRRIYVAGSKGMAETQLASHFKQITDNGVQTFNTSPKDYLNSLKKFYEHLIASPEEFKNQKNENIQTLSILLAIRESSLQNKLITISFPRPIISLIIPMEIHRGIGIDAVKSWINQQEIDPNQYEIIVVCHRNQTKIKRVLEKILRPQDRLVMLDAENEMHLCHQGAELAQGDVLLFTESHCISEPNVIKNAINFFQRTNYDSFYPTTLPICKNTLAQFEARYYNMGFSSFNEANSWAKVVLHAFGIKKSVYFKTGGLNYRYNRFAYWLLGAKLYLENYSLVHAPDIVVKHYFAASFYDLTTFITEYVSGECKFRKETSDKLFCYDFFSATSEWNIACGFNAKVYFYLMLTILKHLVFKNKLNLPDLINLNKFILHSCFYILFQRYLLLTKFFLKKSISKIAYYLQTNKEKKWLHFLKYQERFNAFYRVKFALNNKNRIYSENNSITFMDENNLFGFHSPEKWKNEYFRWSSNFSAVRLITNSQPNIIRIKFLKIRFFDYNTFIFCINDKLQPDVKINRDHGEIEINVKNFKLKNDFWLIILAKPWNLTPDTRALGLPIQKILFV